MPLPFGLPPADPGIEFFVASRGMSQGIAQTDGLQVRPRLFVAIGNAQIGLQWRNIDSAAANGVGIFSVKYGRRLGKLQVETTAAYRLRTGARRPARVSAWEFSGAARRSFDGWTARLELQYSPEEFGTGQSLYAETGVVIDIARSTTLSVNVGRREREKASAYTSVNAGVTTVIGERLSLDARLFGTDRRRLGAPYRTHAVVSARLTL